MPIYSADQLPEGILENFNKYVKLDPDERLQMLYDKTILGSGKEGIVATDKRVLVYEKSRQRSYHYVDLAHVGIEKVAAVHHKLHLMTPDEELVSLDFYVANDGILKRVVDLAKQKIDEEIWNQSKSVVQLSSDVGPIPVVEDPATPLCPHCLKALNQIHHRELTGMLGRRFVYFCPHCQKVLGFSHRQGYILGS